MKRTKTPEQMSTEELRAALSGYRKVRSAVVAIFGIIIAAWIVMGYWKQNTPVFIVTLVLAAGVTVALTASWSKLSQELRKREARSGASPAQTGDGA